MDKNRHWHWMGVMFFLIAAHLFSARYITGVIYLSLVYRGGDESTLASSLAFAGSPLMIWSVVCFLLGIACFVLPGWKKWREHVRRAIEPAKGMENAEEE